MYIHLQWKLLYPLMIGDGPAAAAKWYDTGKVIPLVQVPANTNLCQLKPAVSK
jgi:hypothetical protein